MRSLAALSLLVAAGCSSNFCSSNVSIPSSKFGNCNQSELNPVVVNGVMPIVTFPDAGACEHIEQSTCSSSETSDINSQISCLNKAVNTLPDCMNGAENVWPANWLGAQCPSGFANNACTQALGLQ